MTSKYNIKSFIQWFGIFWGPGEIRTDTESNYIEAEDFRPLLHIKIVDYHPHVNNHQGNHGTQRAV
jgi:hypothetical protein